MIYTPLSTKTTDELIAEVLNTEGPSWMEIELVQRIEALRDELDDTRDVLSEARKARETLAVVEVQ